MKFFTCQGLICLTIMLTSVVARKPSSARQAFSFAQTCARLALVKGSGVSQRTGPSSSTLRMGSVPNEKPGFVSRPSFLGRLNMMEIGNGREVSGSSFYGTSPSRPHDPKDSDIFQPLSDRDYPNQTIRAAQDTTREVKQETEGLANKAKDKASRAWEAAKDSAGDVKDSVKRGLGVAEEKAEDVKDSAKDNYVSTKKQAKDQGSSAYDSLRQGFHDAKEKAQDTAEDLKKRASRGADKALGQAEDQWDHSKKAAKDVGNTIEDKAHGVEKETDDGGIIDTVKDKAKGAWQGVKETVGAGTEKAERATDKTKDSAGDFKDRASRGANKAFGQAEDQWDQTKKAAKNAGNTVEDKAHDVKRSVERETDDGGIIDSVKDKAKGAWQAVKETVGAGSEKAEETAKDAKKSLRD